jgi:hypothetical protein
MELVNMLSEASTILSRTDDWQAFEKEYSGNLRFSGERMVDGAVFVFDLAKEYTLLVSFSDYSFDNFSIIHKSLSGDVLEQI